MALPTSPPVEQPVESPVPLDGAVSRIFGASEMADRVRGFDWAATPLGGIDCWPESLLTSVNILLGSRHPLVLWWGEELVQFYNDAYRPSLGREKHPRALGQRAQDCWPEVWSSLAPQVSSVFHGGEATWNVDQYLPIYRNGDHLEDAWWTFSYSPVRDAKGEIVGIFIVVSETTARVRTEQELNASRERLQLALEAADLGAWSYNPHDKTFTADATMQRIFGVSTPVGDHAFWQGLLHPDDRRKGREEFEQVLASRSPYNLEYRVLHPGGVRWVRSKGKVLAADGEAEAMFAIVEDITESKLAEIERHAIISDLRESQRIGRMGSWRLVLATGELTWSDEVYRLMDREPGLPVLDFARQPEIIEEDSNRRLVAAIEECLATGKAYEVDTKMFLPSSGRAVWLATRGEAVYGTDGKVVELRGTVRDITDRKLAEEALRDSEERLQLALEAANLGTWSYDSESGISTGDAAMQRIFGSERASGDFAYWIEFAHPDDREAIGADFAAALAGDGAYETEYRIVRPTDGEVRWIRSLGRVLREPDRPLQMLVVVEDITGRKVAEQALLRTEKLAAVGRLASSIAHEINNPLESITNLIYLARSTDDLKQSHEYLALAESELQRASAITTQTLRFHKQSTRPTQVTWEDLTSNALAVLRSRILNARVIVEQRNRAHRPVLCFDGEVRQVVSNLLLNAIDAMPPQGGRLLLRSRQGCDYSTGRPGLIFTIADTGTGMSPQTLARIFEPFYTTKGIAGTGLGLWISKEIVERHHGRLRVRSSQRPGHTGTVFTLFLPFDAATR